MKTKAYSIPTHPRARVPVRVGFMPVTDCAPIVMANELGCFVQHELDVRLFRERDWSVLCDRFANGELDAIHAPSTFPFAISLGINCEPCACVAPLIINLQGNAITLSSALKQQGVMDPDSLHKEIRRLWGRKTLAFGVPHLLSTHSLLLQKWLRQGGVKPEQDVRIIPIPPTEMYPNLKLGYLDGFCVGEPWNSVAVESGVGFCVATSADLAPLHPEKVLVVRREFAERHPTEHLRLIASLIESCRFCDVPANWGRVRPVLEHVDYLNVPLEELLTDTGVPLNLERGSGHNFPAFSIFHRHRANAPTRERAQWILNEMVYHGLIPLLNPVARERLLSTFDNEYFGEAMAMVAEEAMLTNSRKRSGIHAKVNSSPARTVSPGPGFEHGTQHMQPLHPLDAWDEAVLNDKVTEWGEA